MQSSVICYAPISSLQVIESSVYRVVKYHHSGENCSTTPALMNSVSSPSSGTPDNA